MAKAPVDIDIKVKGDSQIDKLQKRMKRLEGGITGVNSKLPQATNNIRNVGRAAGTATGNIQRMGVAFRSTVAPIVAAYAAINFFGKALNTFGRREADVAVLTNGLTKLGATESDLAKLTKQANAFGNATLFDQEDFTAGAGLLTSFSDVAIKDYNRVINVAGDLAQTNKGAVKDSLLQLAKALNAPKEGLTALSRSGIQFTDKQKDLIKALVDTGQKAKAQTIILSELEKQYGGNAVAAATGFKGAQDSLSEAFRDFQEVVGEGVLPVVTDFIKSATDIFTVLSTLNPKVIETAAKAVLMAGKVWLVHKAIAALVGLKAGVSAMLLSTATGLTAAGTAAKVANPFLLKTKALLIGLANIGFITIGVNIVVNGLAKLAEVESRFAALGNTSTNQFGNDVGGSALSAQEIQKLIKENKTETANRRAELESVKFPGLTAQDDIAKDAIEVLKTRAAKLDTMLERAKYATPADRQKADDKRNGVDLKLDPITNAGNKSSGGGGAAAAAPKTDDLKALKGQLDLLKNTKVVFDEINAAKVVGNANSIRVNESRLAGYELLAQQKKAVEDLNTEEGKALQTLINQEELRRFVKNAQTEDAIAERAKATAIADALRPLQEQRQILEGTLAGRGEEVRLQLEIERIMRQFPDLERSKVEELVKGNAELEKQISQAAELDKLYGQIGQRVASGLVDGITAAIDGSKSLQEVLSDVLKDLGSILLNFAVNSAFSQLKIPGFAQGGRPQVGQYSLVGEKGPELVKFDSPGTVIPNNRSKSMLESMGRYSSGGGGGNGGGQAVVNYTGPILNFNEQDYVPASAVPEIINQAARRGAASGKAQTMSAMRNSRGQRSRLGLGG